MRSKRGGHPSAKDWRLAKLLRLLRQLQPADHPFKLQTGTCGFPQVELTRPQRGELQCDHLLIGYVIVQKSHVVREPVHADDEFR